jgi:hypothetical protein
MCSGQTFDGSQSVGRCEVRIPNRHGDILVAQKLLHRPQINPSHNQTACKRMSETMPREFGNSTPNKASQRRIFSIHVNGLTKKISSPGLASVLNFPHLLRAATPDSKIFSVR